MIVPITPEILLTTRNYTVLWDVKINKWFKCVQCKSLNNFESFKYILKTKSSSQSFLTMLFFIFFMTSALNKISSKALSLVVEHDTLEGIDNHNVDLLTGTKHHTILVKKRVFPTIKGAISAARPGDYIYIKKGNITLDLNILKSH